MVRPKGILHCFEWPSAASYPFIWGIWISIRIASYSPWFYIFKSFYDLFSVWTDCTRSPIQVQNTFPVFQHLSYYLPHRGISFHLKQINASVSGAASLGGLWQWQFTDSTGENGRGINPSILHCVEVFPGTISRWAKSTQKTRKSIFCQLLIILFFRIVMLFLTVK